MLDSLLKYANGKSASDEVISWINQIVAAAIKKKKQIFEEEMEHIIDYLVSPAAPKVRLHGVTAVMDITKEAEKAWKSEPWG